MAEKKRRSRAEKKQRGQSVPPRTRREENHMRGIRDHTPGFLDDRNAIALRFHTREASHQAVGIILERAPTHTFLLPDAYTIIMDREDEHLFKGLPYDPQDVAKPGDLTDEEIAQLRYENLFGDMESE